jgi:hypothetical protein
MANILETIQKNDTLKVLLVVLGIYLLYTYFKPQEKYDDSYYGMIPEELENVKPEMTLAQPESKQVIPPLAKIEQQQINKIVAGQDQIKADDLLPKYDDANSFAKENPVSKLLKEQNFLISGYHAGVNTIMQNRKVGNLDLRSLPPIPKESVGPWHQSSYEPSPGQNRRGVEIL